jgi:hypothetical protein
MSLVYLDMLRDSVVANNQIRNATQTGIEINDCDRVNVSDNVIWEAGWDAVNTYDAILLTADTNECHVTGNSVEPSASNTRYGINIGTATCNSNVVVGNNLGGSADYGSGPINNAGTGTVLSYAGGAVGDNVTY